MRRGESKVITVASVEEKNGRYTISDGHEKFSFFREGRNGENQEFGEFLSLGVKKDSTVKIWYQVDKTGKYKNITGFEVATPQESTQVVPFHSGEIVEDRTKSILWQVAWKCAAQLWTGSPDLLAARDAAINIYKDLQNPPV